MKTLILFPLLVCLCGAATSSRHLQQRQQRGYPQTYKSATEFIPTQFNCNKVGRFPFMASVRDGTIAKNHICGGALIAADAVLTAAHCVDPRATRNAIIYPEVQLAGTDLESYVEKLNTVAAFPHPDWTGDIRDGNDLVILKLEENSCTMPLPVLGNRERINRERPYQFFGFGRTSESGAFSSLLQISQLTFIPRDTCERETNVTLREGELCFTGDESIGVCSGDDGGPLVVPPEGLFGLYEELVGIVSYTSDDCGEEGAAIFMNINTYADWINNTLSSRAYRNA